MSQDKLNQLSAQLERLNVEILDNINRHAQLVHDIASLQSDASDLENERNQVSTMLQSLTSANIGPVDNKAVEDIFKKIFSTGNALHKEAPQPRRVSRDYQEADTVIDINGLPLGDGTTRFVVGPCAVESYEQVAAVAKEVKAKGMTILRGGAYKPRTSPYDFQGLGLEGLKILRRVADEYDLAVVSEVVSPEDVEEAAQYLDMIQIGARNMHNFELLKAVGRVDKPVILKRGFAATIEEFINAAEYIISRGNKNIILCERGIRTYETATRNTLDIMSVPILKQETHLPVIVDVTHSTGRRDLLAPAAKAALAIGADGIMAEVHPNPAQALSDTEQQMDFKQFEEFLEAIQHQVIKI